jgi:maltose alpha-D-glucosyltransferase/alpha-amylase
MSYDSHVVPLADDPLWYKDAVIYQLHVKAFLDSSGDGIGDFPGLTARLDYIRALGVNTLWLLPFYPSPMRDDGYDIADYRNIHPDYGTRRDFRLFVREAHRRGLRVIVELVINHTSDQHPWFQAARRAPPGSPKRNYYVWSDTNQKFSDTRIIFTDTERSNWAWDSVANAYYWHRFFSHQPDLNHNNPAVVKAVIRVMRFWLDQGVDGLRLDAIPYLCVREGTNNENLPETHAVIRQMRAVVDAHYRHRMFLAEANQWPEDVREYFGEGDECHMAYHFPLMPRMYLAVAQEDRFPMTEILAQTPEIPPSCQWALFLRNHDELTLEMVTHRERDYMYRIYAADPRMRVNAGIRRRLAPLMDNDVDRIKLLNSLLLSMPGSPIIYYGDEIGMGDNFYLGDRNGMRTPMQWNPDRNAGFSRADPQQLYLPPIMDPVYGYQAVNVEAQSREPSSQLNWMRRLIAVRQAHRAFGRGTFTMLHPGNRKVFAYLRQYEDEVILCVANLARSAQPVELDLCRFRGWVPVELVGGTPFQPVGEQPYPMTLPGHAFFWFRLTPKAEAPEWHQPPTARRELPVLVLTAGLASFFAASANATVVERLHRQLEREALPRFLPGQRWFDGKAPGLETVKIEALTQWSAADGSWLLTVVSCESDGEVQRFFVPLALAWEDRDEELATPLTGKILARVRQRARMGVLYDAFADDGFCRAVLAAVGTGRCRILGDAAGLETEATGAYTLMTVPTAAYPALLATLPAEVTLRRLSEANNNVLVFGERLFLKSFRRLRPEINLDLEMGRFLTEHAPQVRTVPVGGSVELHRADGPPMALAILEGYVENQGDAWSYTQAYLERFLSQALATAQQGCETADERHAGYGLLMTSLGRRAAELHTALAVAHDDPAFAPEPIAPEEPATWAERIAAEAALTLEWLRRDLAVLSEPARDAALAVLARGDRLQARLAVLGAPVVAVKTRVHGHFHLGQVLVTGDDVVLIGFGVGSVGEIEARRTKRSALLDVARLLHSLHAAAATTLLRLTAERPQELTLIEPLVHSWESVACAAFMTGYREHIAGSPVWPAGIGAAEPLLALFCLDLALMDVREVLTNGADRILVPLALLLKLIGD